jgi:hypothetical protein
MGVPASILAQVEQQMDTAAHWNEIVGNTARPKEQRSHAYKKSESIIKEVHAMLSACLNGAPPTPETAAPTSVTSLSSQQTEILKSAGLD